MIISISRRTDIPAFYMEWFLNRLDDGFVYVRNPFNYSQISEVSLRPDDVECFVFWTKNPKAIYDNLDALEAYSFYVQVTINPYDMTVEGNIPDKDTILRSFIDLSRTIGKLRMVWRYDPIIITDEFDQSYHLSKFEETASLLCGYTDTCKVSFLEIYPKIKSNISKLNLKALNKDEKKEMLRQMAVISSKYGIVLESCSSNTDYSDVGVYPGKCIDDIRIGKILGLSALIKKDAGQRKECGCVVSTDIGVYNTCPHMCSYCYANYSFKSTVRNYENHDPNARLLFGKIRDGDVIKKKKTVKYFTDNQ